jgi:hypothetical protein
VRLQPLPGWRDRDRLHHDKRHPLLVASISFGAVRTMGFASRGGKLDKSLPMVPLASGSLLLFSDVINENFKHTIVEDKSVRGPRISVTFREFAADKRPKTAKRETSVAAQQKSKTDGLNPAPAGIYLHALEGEERQRAEQYVRRARVMKILKKNGVDFHPKRQMTPPFGPDGKVGTNLVALFSEQVQRCIAKIAFNYLAKVRGAEFVLHPDFDDIRAFIRYGTQPRVQVVRPLKGSFLLEERHGRVVTRGHILRLDWSVDRQSIVAQVALFNAMKYTVVVCNRYSGVWTGDLAQGHHFDLDNHRIEPLLRTGLAIPVMLVPPQFSPLATGKVRRNRRVV